MVEPPQPARTKPHSGSRRRPGPPNVRQHTQRGRYKLGLGLEFELGQTWAIEPALVYYGKGWREKDETIIYRDDNGDPILDEDTEEPLTGTRRTTYSAGYVELPVLIHYYLRTAEAQYLKFSAGPYVACGVSGKMKVQGDADRQGSDKLFYDASTFSQPGIKRWDAGVQLRLSYQPTRQHQAVGIGD